MRIKCLILIVISCCAARVFAAPFLVCDPYPTQTDANLTVASFVLTGFGTGPVSVPAFVLANGQQELHYDLATLSNGTYTVTAAAVNAFGVSSAASPNFTFTKGVPATPLNLKISPL